ncbi:histidine kinase [Bacillus sp. FJAT-29937]|uniref:histidine kinase n=1 Tax=Bacillus sp. FJAT-29937 TaxID=1720553 RepID=UPI00082EB74C|nr:histidine kinase [Bacillus sp. FJAT-29937]
MRQLALVIPIMLIVGAAAMWMLHRDYSVLDYQTRVIISAGAALFSGLISFFLFKTGKANND